jgi:hypothetical protein
MTALYCLAISFAIGLTALPHAIAAEPAWQQDSYVNIHSGTGACLELCVGVFSNVAVTIPSDATYLDVRVHDATGLQVPFVVRFADAEGDTASYQGCGALDGLAVPDWATGLDILLTDASSHVCESPAATTGTIELRLNGSWTPQRRECYMPLDPIFSDPDCS